MFVRQPGHEGELKITSGRVALSIRVFFRIYRHDVRHWINWVDMAKIDRIGHTY